MNTAAPIKELTWDEQATWGTCAACGASHGEPCDPDIGWALGGVRPQNGAHLCRIKNAPQRVRLERAA